MANTLISPGVHVSVIDESMYTSAGQGTVPLIIVATHKNKTHPSGTGIAEGTLPENSGVLRLLSSQREAIQYLGYPKFYYDDIGTPLHGYELNEYGVHALYSYLSTANRAYVLPAAIDMNQLAPSSTEPKGPPLSGTFWLDTKETSFGVFMSDGSSIPGNAWKNSKTRVIDTSYEVENIVTGTKQFVDPSLDIVFPTETTIVINKTSITVSGTLSQVVADINAENLPGIVAVIFKNGQASSIQIKNINNGALDFTGTQVDVFEGLGLTNSTYMVPKSTLGKLGDFAIVTLGRDNVLYQKLVPLTVEGYPDPDAIPFYFIVGSDEWKMATPTISIGTDFNPVLLTDTDSFRINGSNPITIGRMRTLADIATAINAANIKNITATVVSATQIRITNIAGSDLILENVTGTPLSVMGLISVPGNRMFYSSHTQYPTNSVSGDVWIKTTEYNNGAKWVVKVYSKITGKWMLVQAPLIGNSPKTDTETQEEADDKEASKYYGNSLLEGVLYVRYNLYGTPSNPIASHDIRRYNGKNWEPLSYEASTSQPTTKAEDGTMWYSENFKVDIMVNLNGSQWVGYKKHPNCLFTDDQGPFIQGSTPLKHRNGNPLRQNDIWIDTSDLEKYPSIYRYNEVSKQWVSVDNTDQTTPFGIVFDDVRSDSGPRLNPTDTYTAYSDNPADMVLSNYVDPDCVDPRLYPDGTLLFNMRYSTLDVKQYKQNYFAGEFDGNDYSTMSYNVGDVTFPPLEDVGRWVTVSGLKIDGSPYMWRKAQRAMIVRSLQEVIISNEDARNEALFFNLISCPGYVETIDEMIQLNIDKKETAFIVADTPSRLKPTANDIQNWSVPLLEGQVLPTSEDMLGINNYNVAIYYPWGISTNLDGNEIMVPPSTMALKTIQLSDAVSYPWYAPAGTNRGLVTNAISVGYLTDNNEFHTTFLNERQRDALYINKINPISYIPNRGLMIYGQKTLHGAESALDRVNVARLMCHLRYQFDRLAQEFLFEPNVAHTRESARITYEKFLAELIATNGIYDFVVVCDETNNTPPRIDRNELWIDIAISPVKAIEFIYIPVRIKNTGEI